MLMLVSMLLSLNKAIYGIGMWMTVVSVWMWLSILVSVNTYSIVFLVCGLWNENCWHGCSVWQCSVHNSSLQCDLVYFCVSYHQILRYHMEHNENPVHIMHIMETCKRFGWAWPPCFCLCHYMLLQIISFSLLIKFCNCHLSAFRIWF